MTRNAPPELCSARLPNNDVGKAIEVVVVGYEIAQAETLHHGEHESVIHEQPERSHMAFGGEDVVLIDRFHAQWKLKSFSQCQGKLQRFHDFARSPQLVQCVALLDAKLLGSLCDHDAMPCLGQDMRGDRSHNFIAFDSFKEPNRFFRQRWDLHVKIDKYIGVNEYLTAEGEALQHF